jgi:hypothetical protein
VKWSNFSYDDSSRVIKKLDLTKTDANSRDEVYWYWLDGKKAARVIMPNRHSRSSLSSGFITNIRHNLKLTTREFEDLVDCPLTAEQYAELFRARINTE